MSCISCRFPVGRNGLLAVAMLMSWSTFLTSTVALAHGKVQHGDVATNNGVEVGSGTSELNAATTLPDTLSEIGGAFSLINHHGEAVTDKTYQGKHMLVFFGYVNCQVMCSISLKRIGDAMALLQTESAIEFDEFNALIVTVDPNSDTPERLKESLHRYHPKLTGLTGSELQLKEVYEAYGQNPQLQPIEFNEQTLVSHSSYFYLMGPDGKLKTLFPPILSAASMASLLRRHLSS